MTKPDPWYLVENTTSEEFILRMLELGNPTEIALVGVFDKEGRGSRRDVEMGMHKDGVYSASKTGIQKQVDIVGLYCIKEGEAKTLIEANGKTDTVILKKGQALIFDNNKCLHGREGKVSDRLLLRIWIEE